LSVGLL